MALIKCPECELQVSDKAISCPHCGYPLDKKGIRRKQPTSKRKRLPNGFGRITEIKDQALRKPFRAMITTGKNEFGRPIGKILGFFETYEKAYQALIDYHRNPYDLDDDITVKQLYEKWSEEYFKNATDTYIRTITSCWAYCSSIENMRAKDIRARHIKGVMDNGFRIECRGRNKGQKISPTAGTKSRIKSMFNLMFDYALEYEIVSMNYARTFDISDEIIQEKESAKQDHIPFTSKELDILWSMWIMSNL